MKIRSEGYPFIGAAGVLLFLSMIVGGAVLRILAALPVLFVAWFFRDPERSTPADKDAVFSPADGKVIEVCDERDPVVGLSTKVAVFMSVLSVHVNRAPVTGTVVDVRYKPGTFHVASLGRKTAANERMSILIETERGMFRVDQVAGLVARRISCWVKPGERVTAGQRIGLIRFGSLLECWMPQGFVPVCERSQMVRAGESPIGRRTQ